MGMDRTGGYVHGHAPREHERLADQAAVLRELLHHDTAFAAGTRVVEIGCGTGEQTRSLVANSPGALLTCTDISEQALATARRNVPGPDYVRADLFQPPFAAARFDHAFVCFVLEHLADPVAALARVRGLVRPGGTVTVIEGDHDGCTFHPDTPAARRVWACLSECQFALGGDPFIGRRLHPLLQAAGFDDVRVEPRIVYCDASRPETMTGFVARTIVPMVEGVREQALAAGLVDAATWARGVRELAATGGPGGAFFYPFFKAVARVPA